MLSKGDWSYFWNTPISLILRSCDRVAFIRAGHLVGVERMADVRASRRHAFRVSFSSKEERERYLQTAIIVKVL